MRVLIIGASGGIGSALVREARARGAVVTGLSRSRDGIEITDADSIAVHLARLKGPFERIIVATGALRIGPHGPEKSLRALDPTALAAQFALNTIGPAMVLRHAVHLLPREHRAVFAVLSARVGSIGDNRSGGWYSYRASKAALNQLIRSAAIELARSHPQLAVVALHPGTVATRLSETYLARHPAVEADEAASGLWSVIEGLEPGDSGRFLDRAGRPVPW